MSYTHTNKMTVQARRRDEMVEILIKSVKFLMVIQGANYISLVKTKMTRQLFQCKNIWTAKKAHQAAIANKNMKQFVQKSMPLLNGMPVQIEMEAVGGKHPLILCT